MTNSEQGNSLTNRHKQMAMGKIIKTMKKGGACMKGGGMAKKPSHAKKKSK
jgi:hypothetical protein